MNISRMSSIRTTIRERIGAAIAVVLASIAFCICGAVFTFVLAPQQALEASRISSLPQMDAQYVSSAQTGADILITGVLVDNPPLFDDSNLIAYALERWEVDSPDPDDDSDSEPDGTWQSIERVIPDLSLDVGGRTIWILAANNAVLNGPVREEIVYGDGFEIAEYEGEYLPEGSLRYRGFYDGDRATVLGKKASTSGSVVPDKLYAGDRVAFEQSERDTAKGLLISGICMMVLAPVVLIGGGLGAVFGRRRRGFRF